MEKPPPFPARSGESTPDPYTPVGVPVDESGIPLIPDLNGRQPSHNEQQIIAGEPINVGSTNVHSYWWAWEPRRLFVRFLDGSLYAYEDVPLSVVVKFLESDSAGRFVWNTLCADGYSYRKLESGTVKNPKPRVIRKHP